MLSFAGLKKRAFFLRAVREFFQSRTYLEVDTPVRLPVLIPEAEIVPLQSEDWFLQTSPEMCMKGLLARGCPRLFQICSCFRKGEKGRLHQEEFTMLEWYRIGWGYQELMTECEEMIQAVAERLSSVMDLPSFGSKLSSPWLRLTVEDAFQQYGKISAEKAVQCGLFDEILVERVEPELGWDQPVFLYDYPEKLASLARLRADNPAVAERFELYISGVELANGFSELTDPDVQRQRFRAEIDKMVAAGYRPAMPEQFLQTLHALPECAGIALGLDRLLMLFSGVDTIEAVRPFGVDEL